DAPAPATRPCDPSHDEGPSGHYAWLLARLANQNVDETSPTKEGPSKCVPHRGFAKTLPPRPSVRATIPGRGTVGPLCLAVGKTRESKRRRNLPDEERPFE